MCYTTLTDIAEAIRSKCGKTDPIKVCQFADEIEEIQAGGLGPIAYEVSSVDELPSNAVEGSMAIIKNNNILGGWYINERPNIADIEGLNFSFTSIYDNGEVLMLVGWYIDVNENELTLYYLNDDGDEFEVYTLRQVDGEYDGHYWSNYGFRFMTITSIPEDYEEQWVRANAIKTKSLYIRENGEWVYKCEVGGSGGSGGIPEGEIVPEYDGSVIIEKANTEGVSV